MVHPAFRRTRTRTPKITAIFLELPANARPDIVKLLGEPGQKSIYLSLKKRSIPPEISVADRPPVIREVKCTRYRRKMLIQELKSSRKVPFTSSRLVLGTSVVRGIVKFDIDVVPGVSMFVGGS